MSRTILVTGASGRLGRRVLRELARRGWRTRALVRHRTVEGAHELVRGDLEHPASLVGVAAGVDTVLHLAGVTHARRASTYEAGNVRATANLLTAVRDAQPGVAHLVHVSTRAIDPSGGAYSRSKHAAEELVHAAGVPFTIVRLAEVYGLDAEGVDTIVERARRGASVLLPGDEVVCPLHADDAVAAVAAACERRGSGRTYTLAGECLTLSELVARVGEAGGTSPRVAVLPRSLLSVLAAASRLLPLPLYPDQPARLRAPKETASVEAERDLGFRPRPLAAAVQQRESVQTLDIALREIANARTYNEWLFARARPLLGERMLDAGAGIGTFTALAADAGAAVVALEPEEEFAVKLDSRFAADERVEVVRASAESLPASLQGAFDSILCLNVLEHVEDDRATLAGFRGALRPGGRLLLLVPAHPQLFGGYDRAAGHLRRYSKTQVERLLAEAGFEIDMLRHVNPVGAAGWFLRVRLRQRDDWPSTSFRTFDRLVPALRHLDRLPLPFGLSLWAVGRRPSAG